MRTLLLAFLCMSPALPAAAQTFTDDALAQGYLHEADTTYFLFDQARYDAGTIEHVVVTGGFRGWSMDMDDPAWTLAPVSEEPGLWMLAVANEGYEAVGPSTPFKFRVNEGVWLNPPAGTPNVEGGNLVFEQGVEPTRLRAELRGPRAVWARLTGAAERSLDPSDYRLVTAQGETIKVAHVAPNTDTEMLIVPAEDLDVRRVYYLEAPAQDLRTLARHDGWYRTLYSTKTLGATVADDGSETHFRVFSPRAGALKLHLYDGRHDAVEAPAATHQMTPGEDGVWEVALPGDLHGTYYTFTVHAEDEGLAQDPGSFFFETHSAYLSDPYARVQDEAWGKSRVWRAETPPPPVVGGRPAMEDVVAYEVHVQDFTDTLPVADALKGTLLGMAEPGLTNEHGEPVGFDYLKRLGINTVHLMPVQEFLHYPDSLWQATFGDDPYFQEQGIAEENYQWGYRTTHAFAVESKFRRKGDEPGAEREQFRQLVEAFHEAGIAVIIDLVPNHTGENMDAAHHLLHWNALDKPYHYRTDEDLEHIGPFGNEVKTEDRPMVQRWLIDQAQMWVEELGVDGFRIDLAGQIDQQSLIAFMDAMPDDVIVYGEPWIPPTDPDVAQNEAWAWYKADAPITFFQDDARNAFKGPTSIPHNKATDRGFAGGHAAERAAAMRGLTNLYDDEARPTSGINYLDIHDNWALADRFATQDWNGLLGVDEPAFKLAAGLLFTSAGPLVLHGGTEIMRSKGIAENVDVVRPFELGTLYIHGKRDTYNLRRANHFLWSTVGQTDGPDDFANMEAYWRGLIDLRMSEHGEVFRQAERLSDDHYRFHLPADEHLLGYTVGGEVLVLMNTGQAAGIFADVPVAAGSWRQVADGVRVDVEGIGGATLSGGTQTVEVPAQTMFIWARE